jgi:hypothetical protein
LRGFFFLSRYFSVLPASKTAHRCAVQGETVENEYDALPADSAGMLNLGAALGQAHAFATMSGRCTAAQAEALRRLREEKQHQRLGLTWEAFCVGYLRTSRSQADRIIALLDEFGPQYFELSQLTRISPTTYRELESSVHNGVLEVYGEPVALIPENAHKVAHAVAAFRAEKAQAEPRSLDARIEALVRHFADVYRWGIHNDVSWRDKLPAALNSMAEMLHGLPPCHYEPITD